MNTTSSLKAVIIEDFKLISDIWKLILEEKGFTVLKTFDNADGIDLEVLDLSPDIILMDINLKGDVNGLQLASSLLKKQEDIRILVISILKDKEYLVEAKKIGVRGYLSKSASVPEIKLAIDTVIKDQVYFKELN